ncbi:transketolase C-terminal domain-containing protein [Roseisolibacter sp. H3M3-2]|uniref:transketolase family protein n=1 Tax=Roseisolibacter sp. H3M3-2 TaxID=3031323 RepID=UPI0023D97D62|nr:transketolase C-terminal domain-containing protein [Roseisolibacter sp. H3M3-2]MDF1502338.1 transketolase C-terminal domain-containing protein [Roseisolibacter sp. H3M3-2]
MRDAFIARLTELAATDPRVMLVTGDLGFGVLTDFAKRFPRQFLNAGVAEQNMTGLATGLALEGRIVFTYSIANFPTLRCLEQIRNDAAYHGASVKVVAVGGGFSYGALGMSHHATEDIAILRSIPDVTVVCPGDDWEAAEATTAITALPGTAYLRLDRAGAGNAAPDGETFALGRSRRLREGEDVTLVATGGILGVALRAADQLATEGVRCRVLSMHTIAPLDQAALLAASRETGGVVTIEEHSVIGGLGGAVAECLLESGAAPARFARVGLRAGFSSIVGSQDYLRSHYGLDVPAVVATVRKLLGAPDVAVRGMPSSA